MRHRCAKCGFLDGEYSRKQRLMARIMLSLGRQILNLNRKYFDCETYSLGAMEIRGQKR